MRDSLLVIGIACLLLGMLSTIEARADGDFKVTLIGTGSPIPRIDRFGPSTLVEAGSRKFLIDAGRGATVRLWQVKVPAGRIDVLFLTHYHSDHTSGIPDLWLTGWLPPPFGQRRTPFHVIGPTGAKVLMENLEKAYALDIKIRIEDEKLPPEGIAVRVEEFDKEGVVYEMSGVKVTAFEVNHGDAIKPAFGYRIDYNGHSAVISGDTRFNENVIKYGAGADLLIHEVAMATPALMQIPAMRRIIAHHTTPKEAGIVFDRAKPKLAVYSHIALFGNERSAKLSLKDLVAETRQTYSGPLEVGKDLTSFEIGDTVTVHHFEP
jgi:ribonuclease Z